MVAPGVRNCGDFLPGNFEFWAFAGGCLDQVFEMFGDVWGICLLMLEDFGLEDSGRIAGKVG